MKPMCQHIFRIFAAVAICIAYTAGHVSAQSVSLVPDEVANSVEAISGDQFHQRIDITLGGTATAATRAFTITTPPELTVVATSITAATNSAALTAFYAGAPTPSSYAFGVTGIAASVRVTVEFDLTTPTSFTGIPEGGRQDTAYSIAFTSTLGSSADLPVAKLQNRRSAQFSFSTPDSIQGDTSAAGGRYYKLTFPSALPDLSHTGISGLSASAGSSDGRTDVLYSFYLSTDSSLVRRPLGLGEATFFTIGADRSPLVGSRQIPRVVPNTFIRENYNSVFASGSADSTNAVISLEGTINNGTYYIYVLADPAPDRLPSQRLLNGGSTKPGYDPTRRGTFTAGAFLARSGPLFITHPPEFVIVGWDYDNDGGDDFGSTGVVQVPTDIPGMAAADVNRKDNRNVTLDTGSFVARGLAINTLNNGNPPSPISSLDLLYVAQDADNSNDFRMAIFLSQQSGLTAADLVGTGIDSLSTAIKITGSDTLSIANNVFRLTGLVQDSVTQLVTSFVPEGAYSVYFAATDGDDSHRIVKQVQDDPFGSNPAFTTLTITHSPNLIPDAFALNDFDGSGDGDLDVVTGIDVSQMQTDIDGKDLSPGPAQRYVTISWGSIGFDGDVDVDDDATIDLYYSTRSDFRDINGSDAYTSGNSDGSDLLNRIALGDNDTHTIVTGIREDPDGKLDNQYPWDIWSYVSSASEGSSVPRTDTRYYIYAILQGGNTRRLVSLTQSGNAGVVFTHPPYIRGTEPARDIAVAVNEPVVVRWEAVDVDNGGGAGDILPAQGLTAPDDRTNSPNIRILLSSADFGKVTTWASVSNPAQTERFWLANSTDGSLGTEIELNEGVDTSFVLLGNRLRNNTGLGSSSASLELQTAGGVGETYFVYLAIDAGLRGVTGGQPTDFTGYSPLVRMPGRITFTGVVPASPPTAARFVVPPSQVAVEGQQVVYPIIPDEGDPTGSTQIRLVNIFLTLDNNLFEPIDTDPVTAGVQPFSLGTNAAISGANVDQIARITSAGELSLEFIYSDITGGLTFFDGVQPLAFANFRARKLSGGDAVDTFIEMGNAEPRRSSMRDAVLTDIDAAVPSRSHIRIVRRASVSGTVPLQSRTVSADTITFFLREVGSFAAVNDSLFGLNDIDPARVGVQVATSGVNGEFQLRGVPDGRFILVAAKDRHLSGHDTLDVDPGLDVTGFQPTLDGDGVDRAELLAGDIAGFSDSTGTSIPDNFIDGQDISAVNSALFAIAGEADYNTYADLNRDGIVNATDKDYTAVNRTNNSGQAGFIRPVLPTFKQALNDGDNADAILTLIGVPEAPVRVGEAFDVTVSLEGGRRIRTYELHLGFDPSVLAVEDVVSSGSLFENYVADIGGKVREGDLGLVNSIIGETPIGASGNGTLATVRLRAVREAGAVELAVSDALLIDVDFAEARPVLGPPAVVRIAGGLLVYHDASGNELRALIEAHVDPRVDFNDFVAFTRAFDSTVGDSQFNPRADLNADGRIDFADFVMFSMEFGREAVDAPSSGGAAKPAVAPDPDVDGERGSILLRSEAPTPGGDILLKAGVAGSRMLQGWQMTLRFDPDLFSFVEARAPHVNLLESAGGRAPLMLVHAAKPGEVTIASVIQKGPPAFGDGDLAELVFRPRAALRSGEIEAVDGFLYDPRNRRSAGQTAQARVFLGGPRQGVLGPVRDLVDRVLSALD